MKKTDYEVIAIVEKKYVSKYKEGYPLILKQAINNINELNNEGEKKKRMWKGIN